MLRREDGISIDQIVLSAGRYLNAAPGAAKRYDDRSEVRWEARGRKPEAGS